MAEPLIVYTGTEVWVGKPQIREARKGRVEHGPGLYFTTSRQTAMKYGKGRRTVLRVEIDPSFTWLEDATAPTEELVRWVLGQRGLRKKKEIIDDLVSRGERGLSPGTARVSALVNLMVNYEAITGPHGPALAEFLVEMGIGASHVRQGEEDWIVLFDPDKVVDWRRVGDDDAWHLPKVRRHG
jgi:hypothetical protein